MNKRSFTLLEMLVVLGIIAIILSVLTVSFSTAQKKSRDAKRKGDIKALQSGLEQYYSACSYVYPSGTLPTGTPLVCGGSPAIISIIPVDPKTGVGYTYTPTGTTGIMEMIAGEPPHTRGVPVGNVPEG